MQTLILIGDILCMLSFLGLICVIFFLVDKVGKYETELAYLKSVLSQTIEHCEKNDEELKKHIKHSKDASRKAFFKGLNSKK